MEPFYLSSWERHFLPKMGNFGKNIPINLFLASSAAPQHRITIVSALSPSQQSHMNSLIPQSTSSSAPPLQHINSTSHLSQQYLNVVSMRPQSHSLIIQNHGKYHLRDSSLVSCQTKMLNTNQHHMRNNSRPHTQHQYNKVQLQKVKLQRKLSQYIN